MKEIGWMETEAATTKTKLAPPPPPPLPKTWVAKKPASQSEITVSITNQEIARFWRQKRLIEEDHFLAAIKAAARIRACKMTEEDYRHFEECLQRDDDEDDDDGNNMESKASKKEENTTVRRIGIKDWWTKSKYAYLNQPAIDHDKFIDTPTPRRRTYSYIPNFCNYKAAAPPLPTTTFGIF